MRCSGGDVAAARPPPEASPWSRLSALLACALSVSALSGAVEGTPPPAGQPAPTQIDIEPVWSGHSVGFSLVTEKERQFAAYYDAQRQLTVAERALDAASWTFTRLPTHLGWDSHNYVTMAIDGAGFLHVSGNMHCVPLLYFRASRPHDATSLEQVATMVDGRREQRATYPVFFRGADGQLIFRYRDGASGNGNDFYNSYDTASRSWRSLLATPLSDGRGRMNAYFAAPLLGPGGWFHTWGVWRNSPDCATNHDLSYARSRDLIHWQKGDGTPLTLPITVDNADIVDPVPAGGGLLNGLSALGFDGRERPIISYHKYDAAGGSQVFCVRLEEGVWRRYQTTDWKGVRFSFSGGGSLPGTEVGMGAATLLADGSLSMSLRHPTDHRTWILDAATLKPTVPAPPAARCLYPPTWNTMESSFPGMLKRHCESLGERGPGRIRYALSWETLSANRDQPRKGPLPAPSMLRLCTIIDTP